MSRLILPTVALALMLASGARASEEITARDRFKLWNDCRKMGLVIEDLPKSATDIGLTREMITVAARSRLRAAHLYRADALAVPFLGVTVHVVGTAFYVSTEYGKLMTDSASGTLWGATTWRTETLGTHGRDASFIRSIVAEKTEKFIDEYLRVNADACRKSK